MADYIPGPDASFQAWQSNFVTYANANLAALGLTAADMAPITSAQSGWATAFPAPKSGEQDFNHTAPADWLVRQRIDYTLADEAAALDRFEKLFTDLNKLLEPTSDGSVPVVVTTVAHRAAIRR